MAIQVQLRRGTTAQNNAFTGAVGEVTVDTDKDTAVVHDGATAGGFPLVGEKGAQTITGVKTFDNGLATDTISEETSAAGVTIDGVLLKDNGVVTGAGTVSAPVYSTTGDTNTGIFFPAADTIAFAEGGAEAMRIDSSGQLMLGTTTSTNTLSVDIQNVSASSNNVLVRIRNTNNNEDAGLIIDGKNGGTQREYKIGVNTTANSPDLTFSGPTGYQWYVGATERARITSGGEFLVNTTSNNGKLTVSSPCDTVKTGLAVLNEDAGAGTFVGFINSAGNTAGAITQTGTTTVNYGTSSDYRLKENVAPMTGALDKVMALKPCTYTWKEDGSAGEGFIAHELQAVCPDAVVGEKDATEIRQVEVSPAVYEDVVTPAVLDEDGNEVEPERTEKRLVSEAVMEDREFPKYQGVDTSFLVATLTAAIQELSAKNDALEARLAALEAQ